MGVQQERLVRSFAALVQIDAPSYGERAMADELKRRLAALGIEAQEDDAGAKIGGTAGNLIAAVPGELALPPLLFSAHMDTVAPALGKRAVRRPDGRITSGGDTVLGADDAAGLAAILEALTVLREEGLPHRPLELVFPAAEEPYTKGSSQLDFTRLRAREAYVLDMTGAVGTAALQAPSILYFRAVLHGRAAHAGMAPELGIHAIKAAAAAVHRIPVGQVDEATTVNIGQIRGGLATNIVPEECTVEGEVRGFVHARALERLKEIEEVFRQEAARAGAALEFAPEVRTVAYNEAPDSPTVQRFVRAGRAAGLPVALDKTFGGSDNNTFAAHGIHGIVLASAMHEVHSTQEYTTVQELADLSRLTLALMLDRE